jgi:hypothetical protein
MKLVFVLFFVSTGSYNQGTVTNYEHDFSTKQQCETVAKQLNEAEHGLWGRTTTVCVQVEKEG